MSRALHGRTEGPGPERAPPGEIPISDICNRHGIAHAEGSLPLSGTRERLRAPRAASASWSEGSRDSKRCELLDTRCYPERAPADPREATHTSLPEDPNA